MNQPVICLMGTTATGKTDAAAALFKRFPAEIISVDSSLVYRGMDIGSAKPDANFLTRYPHHLVDIRHPNDTWSVAEFYEQASRLINQIQARGSLPILVGGTHFYFSALEEGIADLPAANDELRTQISQQAATKGWPALHQQLAVLDSRRAASIDPNDAQRIQRALEIVLQSGKKLADHPNRSKPGIAQPLIKIALVYSERQYLHQCIERRFDRMLEQGLKQEVEGLLANGVNPDTTAMKMIGYRQMLAHLNGELSASEMRDQGIAATRQLAKRQLTWLRNQANICWWVDFGLKDRSYEPLGQFVKQFVK